LADIKPEKEKIEEKVKNLGRELLIRRGLLTVLNLLHQILLTKIPLKLKHFRLSQAIVYSSMSSYPAYVSLPNLCCGAAEGERNTTHTIIGFW